MEGAAGGGVDVVAVSGLGEGQGRHRVGLKEMLDEGKVRCAHKDGGSAGVSV